MSSPRGVGQRIDAAVARYADSPIPDPKGVPRWVAPLPEWLENVGLRLAWLVVFTNLAGTAFGFWFYGNHLAAAPLPAWPLIPVSPLATLYMALSLTAWRLGRPSELLNTVAFFGCIKYGLWTVVVQGVIQGPGYVAPALWQFLIWSHAAMVVQAFLVYRYAEFPLWAVAAATGWFAFNDAVDYFVPVFGDLHHTRITALYRNGVLDRSLLAFDQMAAAAVATTVLTAVLAVATWWALAGRRAGDDSVRRSGS